MLQNDDEKKYEDVIQKLKNLFKVNAPANFESDLKRRINAEETSGMKSFWDKLILPSRLIPSAGLAAAAMIIFFMITLSPEEMDNPFLIEPKIRQNIIEVDNVEGFYDKDEIRSQEKPGQRPDLRDEKQKSVGKTNAAGEELLMKKETSENDMLISETESTEQETTLADVTEQAAVQMNVGGYQAKSEMKINKEVLNFRQVLLNAQEQQVVNELRNKLQLNEQKKADYKK